MKLARWVADFSVHRRGVVVGVTLLATLAVGLVAALPSIWPSAFPGLHGVAVDTDPQCRTQRPLDDRRRCAAGGGQSQQPDCQRYWTQPVQPRLQYCEA